MLHVSLSLINEFGYKTFAVHIRILFLLYSTNSCLYTLIFEPGLSISYKIACSLSEGRNAIHLKRL